MSERSRVTTSRSNMAPAAKMPVAKAPSAKGHPNMAETAMPGTTEWERASPISDQPLSMRNTDRNAHMAPTSAQTQMARAM